VWLLRPEQAMPGSPGPPGGSWAGTGGRAVPANAVDDFLGSCHFSAIESLTRRERDVLRLLLDGLRVSSIARRLYLSPQTVRNHLKAIFRKLGAHSQVELLENLRAATPGERSLLPVPAAKPGRRN
ncbi:MAG: helix-turn-helix domain-containing protein, partial [Acidimicrobiales bacterium]